MSLNSAYLTVVDWRDLDEHVGEDGRCQRRHCAVWDGQHQLLRVRGAQEHGAHELLGNSGLLSHQQPKPQRGAWCGSGSWV